jgi:tetratricopeptide (TPR) repeat protein
MNRITSYIATLIISLSFGACKTFHKAQEKAGSSSFVLTERQRMQFDFMFYDAIKQKSLENPEKAIKIFQECLNLDSSNDAVMHELSVLFLAKKEMESALFFAEAALKIAPNNKWYLLKAAEIYTLNGAYNDAADIYNELLKIQPQNPEWHYSLANAYIQSKDWKKAIATYNNIESFIGINEELSFQKQKLYLQMNNQKAAIEEIQRLIDYRPTEPRYYGMMAELYMINNDPETALTYIDQLLEIAPDNGMALFSKALFLQEIGEYDASFIYLKQAFYAPEVEVAKKIEILLSFYDLSASNLEMQSKAFELCSIMEEMHPNSSRFYAIYGKFFYRAKMNTKSYNAFKKSTELNPGSWENWAIRLEISAVEGRMSILDTDAEQALALFPEQGLAYYFGGFAKFRLGQFQKAVEILDRGQYFTSDPSIKAEMNFFLGLSLLEAQEFDKAYKAYDKALKINPSYSGVLNSYSYSLAIRSVQLEKAAKMSLKSLELEPNSAAYLDTYAWVLFKQGKFDDALVWINKAVKATEKNPSGEILEHKGDILYKMGLTEKAISLWKEAKLLGDTSDAINRKVETGKLDD